MSTDKQLEANRRNALHSTGPKTEEGGEACKDNALRQGFLRPEDLDRIKRYA
jgi:hypothetical protein